MSINIELTGVDDISKALLKVGAKAREIEESALHKGGEVILNAAKNNLDSIITSKRKGTGRLKDNLSISKIKQKRGQRYILVGIEKDDTSEIFYGKFLEWGTIPHIIKIRRGKSAGRIIAHPGISPRPFLGPAYESKKDEVERIIANEFRKALKL